MPARDHLTHPHAPFSRGSKCVAILTTQGLRPGLNSCAPDGANWKLIAPTHHQFGSDSISTLLPTIGIDIRIFR